MVHCRSRNKEEAGSGELLYRYSVALRFRHRTSDLEFERQVPPWFAAAHVIGPDGASAALSCAVLLHFTGQSLL